MRDHANVDDPASLCLEETAWDRCVTDDAVACPLPLFFSSESPRAIVKVHENHNSNGGLDDNTPRRRGHNFFSLYEQYAARNKNTRGSLQKYKNADRQRYYHCMEAQQPWPEEIDHTDPLCYHTGHTSSLFQKAGTT